MTDFLDVTIQDIPLNMQSYCLNQWTRCKRYKNMIDDEFETLRKVWSYGYFPIKYPENVLIEPDKQYALDSYYGIISFYDWHKTPIENGGEFTPIFYHIKRLKKEYVDEHKILDFICRKITFLNVSQMEIDYLSERYNWSGRNEIKEIFLAKFENFTTSIIELFITSINLYETIGLKKDKSELKRFESILEFLADNNNNLPSYYDWGTEISIKFTIYIFVRNSIVHNFKDIEYLSDMQNPILKIENIPSKKRYGIFNKYIEKTFEQYNGNENPNTFHEYIDSRFPYLNIHFYLTRKSTLDVDKSKIEFKMDTVSLSKNMLDDLFILQRNLFENIKP